MVPNVSVVSKAKNPIVSFLHSFSQSFILANQVRIIPLSGPKASCYTLDKDKSRCYKEAGTYMKQNQTNLIKAKNRKERRRAIWQHRELYMFMLPALVALILFSYVPMYGVVMAFQDVKIGNPFGQNEWIGLYHFKRFFNSSWFTTVLKNTVAITFLNNVLTWPFPVLLALLLHNCVFKRLKKIAQTATYLPHMLSLVLIVSIINVFCSGESGLINILLQNLGYDRINFFGEPKWVYPLYVVSHIWAETGYGAIIYLGALSAVDEELIEAAKMDGAGKLRQIWHVQLPTILPTVVTMLILTMGRAFAMGADKMLLLQTDLNLSASEIISTYVYKTGIEGAQYGFSTAVGLFQNVINVILLLVVNGISKKLSDISIL